MNKRDTNCNSGRVLFEFITFDDTSGLRNKSKDGETHRVNSGPEYHL